MEHLEVAVGVLADSSGRILLARRPDSVHLGGLWEFPGGKIHPGESVPAALRREMKEELGIDVGPARPLIRIRHRYPECSVALHVFRIEGYSGCAEGREGQAIRWVDERDLSRFDFPEANLPIISAIRLPPVWAIVNEDSFDSGYLIKRFHELFARGVTGIQIRSAPGVSAARFTETVRPLCATAVRLGVRLVLNSEPGIAVAAGAAGVHLKSRLLSCLNARPLARDYWVGASCHTLDEMLNAQRLGLDYVFLSPVRATASHPASEPLGWERFTSLVDRVNIPVYALGGMKPTDLESARDHGAQGIAGISGFME